MNEQEKNTNLNETQSSQKKEVENMINSNPNKEITIEDIFDNFIKPGNIVREKEIAPGLKIKLKPLNTEEILRAESIITHNNPGIDPNIVYKIRGASILSLSIITLNDIDIENDKYNEKENLLRRRTLYKKILELPPKIIQDSFQFYTDVVNEQNKIFEDPAKASGEFKNF